MVKKQRQVPNVYCDLEQKSVALLVPFLGVTFNGQQMVINLKRNEENNTFFLDKCSHCLASVFEKVYPGRCYNLRE